MARRESKRIRSSVAGVGDHAAGHQSIPDEQHHQRAYGCGDEASALVGAVVADGLTDPGSEKRAGDAEYGRQDEAGRIVWAGRNEPRDDPGDKADNDDPE